MWSPGPRAQSGECADGLLAAERVQFVDETGLAGGAEERSEER